MKGRWINAPHQVRIPDLGAAPTLVANRWYAKSGDRIMQWTEGLGAVDLANPSNLPIIDAANAVIDYLNSNGCTQASIPAVATFQTQYNATGQPGQLTVDGQYGGNTQAALQNIINQATADAGAGPAQSAPANCFGMAVPARPALDPPLAGGSSTTITTTTTDTTSTSTMPTWAPWLVGGAVVAGAGLIGYTIWKKKHRRG